MTAIRPVGPRPLPAIRQRPRVAAPADPEEPVEALQAVVKEEAQREARPSDSQELGERRDARSRAEAAAWEYEKNAQKPPTFKAKI